jgi:glycine cleavage system H protein
MKSNRILFWLQVGVFTLLLVLLFPLLALSAFVARFAVLIVAVAALAVGLVLYATNPRCREWFALFGASEVQYKGLRLATDVAVAPTHAWARRDRDGFVVGSDDLAPCVLGPIAAVELPAIGRWFRRGEPFAQLRRANRSITLRAPVSGTVTTRNETLLLQPALVNDEPYADGWMVRMRSDAVQNERGFLQHGRRARAWFREETDRLIGTLLARGEHAAVLGDGGELVGQLHQHIDDDAWRRVNEAIFAADLPEVTR